MSTEDKLREIQTRRTQFQGSKVRAQVEHDNAVARKQEAEEALQKEYGVVGVEQARELLEKLRKERDDQLAAVEAALTKAGA